MFRARRDYLTRPRTARGSYVPARVSAETSGCPPADFDDLQGKRVCAVKGPCFDGAMPPVE